MFTSWYWGTPPPPVFIIQRLRGNFVQVFEFKGVNLQSIQNKGVIGALRTIYPLESMICSE